MASKVKMRRLTLFSAIISLLSFVYKAGLGVYTMSLVMIIASISTLCVFICKIIFVKNVTASRESKKKAYIAMAITAFIYSLIFVLFAVLKVNNIDISRTNNYQGWIELLFIGFLLLMFILSLINLKGALEKTDIMVIGLKEITFLSALTDLVIIEQFVSRIIQKYYELPIMNTIDAYVPLGVGVVLLIIPVIMFIKSIRYKA
ncbi:MAG: hypothetical protein E7178_00330 [Erysipelotrichaceae bacterium]|jgi:hypothetical protein|nr:hypothetical protein [Erysipelotrichaceae bacterium]